VLVGVQVLGDGDEADPVPLKFLDVVQAVDEGAAEAIQFPDQEDVESPCPGVFPSSG
jgi:hypothetical protein